MNVAASLNRGTRGVHYIIAAPIYDCEHEWHFCLMQFFAEVYFVFIMQANFVD
jgi:hypothetical protein